jgi:hypothetical protein
MTEATTLDVIPADQPQAGIKATIMKDGERVVAWQALWGSENASWRLHNPLGSHDLYLSVRAFGDDDWAITVKVVHPDRYGFIQPVAGPGEMIAIASSFLRQPLD